MKSILTHAVALAMLGLVQISCAQSVRQLPSIKSGIETISYRVGAETSDGWKISPEIKPDRLEVEVKQRRMPVAFITDIDSVKFTIKEGDTVRFSVQYHGEEALTEVVGVSKNVNFSKSYIKAHKGKSIIEVPEVHELANILVALSRIGQQDSNMVDMTTPYYKEVMSYFAPYQNHPLLDIINQHIVKPFDNESYWYYYALKMNACGYVFNKKGNIVNEGIIRKMGFNHPDDPIKANLALVNDFARKSKFREFYKQHQPYYQSLIKTYEGLNPMDKMQTWLEGKFPFTYGSYRVTFSPLVGGAHATNRFEDNDFTQTVMFVCRSKPSDKNSKALNEMQDSRVVFTEIDHNFVNPVSDGYLKQINEVFGDRQKWTKEKNGTSAYGSPYAVFNEYMTWAVFSLYCLDNFPAEEVAAFLPRMERQMENSRGFSRFGDFNKQLITLYKANPDKKVNELYEEMLAWSKALQ
ncbi:DUF4932 domain-containing protein [Pontibacter sp. SGAir0037]|uniref:DUF4932 domain-containing protein n=1 Tax=Pontibacter sp. SGAir0037 TaxID=2571030 RepID=UPI0010CCDF48|nr:DUF4932 domain-containing protein [Pontibacter sp. SGAir0037]QCR23592.1 DUF4932 domain-containing protein [Pontibacter sp. SGAir0037]